MPDIHFMKVFLLPEKNRLLRMLAFADGRDDVAGYASEMLAKAIEEAGFSALEAALDAQPALEPMPEPEPEPKPKPKKRKKYVHHKRRKPCPICGRLIYPQAMVQHMKACRRKHAAQKL